MITVYHMSNKYHGEVILLSPRIPENTAFGEDTHLPRICVTPSIAGCIYALPNFPPLDEGINTMQWYLYSTVLDGDELLDAYHPDSAEVPDVWKTGEIWLLKPTVFDLERTYIARMQARLVGTPYSRWSFTELEHESVRNDIIGDVSYGCPAAFSIMVYDRIYGHSKTRDAVANVQFTQER